MAYDYKADIGIRMDIVELLPYLEELAEQKAFVLELGTQYGNGSTLALMNGLRASTELFKLMVSVDVDDQISEGRRPIEDYWNFIIGNSSAERVYDDAAVLMGINKFDIIFIDSFHKVYHAKDEINLWLPLSNDSTIWLFHDVWDDQLNEENEFSLAIRDFVTSLGYSYEIVNQECQGLAKMIKE